MSGSDAGGSGVGSAYLAEARAQLAACAKKLAHCVGQLDDAQVWWRPREAQNSVGNLLLHLSGNLTQRLCFVVGGEPDHRDRPAEFAERGPIPKAELLRRLEEAVGRVDAALAGLEPARLLERRRYRVVAGETEGTILSVILRTLIHLGGHTQEVIYITRSQLGDAYEFESAPPSPGRGAPA